MQSRRVLMGRAPVQTRCGKAWHSEGRRRSPGMSTSPAYTRYSRFNANGSGRYGTRSLQEPPKPTRAQSALELTLFAAFALLIVFAAIALYTSYSPAHKIVPHTVADGLKQ